MKGTAWSDIFFGCLIFSVMLTAIFSFCDFKGFVALMSGLSLLFLVLVIYFLRIESKPDGVLWVNTRDSDAKPDIYVEFNKPFVDFKKKNRVVLRVNVVKRYDRKYMKSK